MRTENDVRVSVAEETDDGRHDEHSKTHAKHRTLQQRKHSTISDDEKRDDILLKCWHKFSYARCDFSDVNGLIF